MRTLRTTILLGHLVALIAVTAQVGFTPLGLETVAIAAALIACSAVGVAVLPWSDESMKETEDAVLYVRDLAVSLWRRQ